MSDPRDEELERLRQENARLRGCLAMAVGGMSDSSVEALCAQAAAKAEIRNRWGRPDPAA